MYFVLLSSRTSTFTIFFSVIYYIAAVSIRPVTTQQVIVQYFFIQISTTICIYLYILLPILNGYVSLNLLLLLLLHYALYMYSKQQKCLPIPIIKKKRIRKLGDNSSSKTFVAGFNSTISICAPRYQKSYSKFHVAIQNEWGHALSAQCSKNGNIVLLQKKFWAWMGTC